MLEKRTINKIRNLAGESIAETLIALLVAALALTMLAGAISGSASIITSGRNKLKEYYSKNEESTGVVLMTGSGTDKSIKISSTDLTDETVPIVYYENPVFGGNKKVISYKYKR